MIAALLGVKGGVGKSTLAVSFAGELFAQGRSVLLVDADSKNRTCLRAAAMAEERGRAHPTTIGMPAEEMCRGIPRLARGYEWVIIDAPGRGGADLTAPVMVSDLALFPSAPTTADAGVYEEQLEAIAPALRANKRVRLAIVLSKLLSRTRLSREGEADEVFAPTGLKVLRARTHTRLAWQRCLDVGLGVTQHAKASAAAEELRALLAEIVRMGKGGK